MDSNAQSIVEAKWEIIRRLGRWALFLVILACFAYILYRIRSVVMAVFAAVLVTYILLPGVEWLCRKRHPRLRPKVQRLIASILIFAVFLSFIAASVSLFVAPVTSEMSEFVHSFGQYQKTFVGFVEKVWKAVPSSGKDIVRTIDYSKLSARAQDYVEGLVRFATSSVRVILELVLIPVLAFYFVYDYKSITCELYGLVPRGKRRDAVRIGRMAGEMMQSYIFGQLILCAIAGVLTWLVLSWLGIKYVAVLALLAAVTRAIPIIGPIASGIPIVLVGALSTPGDVRIPLILSIFVIVMHFVESKFIMPQLIGHRLRLHPAVVIIVLLIGAEFFGLLGMFLAAPVAAIIRNLLRRYYIKPRERRPAVAAAPSTH